MQLLTNKDLAQELQLHPETVVRLAKRLGVSPSIPASKCYRWTRKQVEKLVLAWKREAVRQAIRKTSKLAIVQRRAKSAMA